MATAIQKTRVAKYSDDDCWAIVNRRDAKADFYYSVRTTGIYCRPACPSRLPLRKNVAFHKSCEAAEKAGFRACNRCRPNEQTLAASHALAAAKACRYIESSGESPALKTLAAIAGMSQFHFHRVFKAVTGITPRAYAEAHRARQTQQALPRSRTVTEAIYAGGFNSGGRFYAKTNDLLGMKPKHFREGGKLETIRFALGDCSLGAILVAATDKGICAILLGDDPDLLLRDLQDRFPKAELIGGDAKFEKMVARVVGFIETPRLGLDLPLDIRGTAFQQRVWQALLKVPAGATLSYTDVAKRIGAPTAVRAVASAIAANAIAVAIPCHRVVRNDGALSGYRWGTERKRKLLAIEASV